MADINFFYDRSGSDIRSWANTPFNVDQYTIACNGHILLIQPAMDEFSSVDVKQPKNVIEVVKRIVLHTYQPAIERPTLPEKYECKTCNGTGKVTHQECIECDGDGEVKLFNGYNSYDCECKTCHGDGKIVRPGGEKPCERCYGSGKTFGGHGRYAAVQWSGITIAARYADLIINDPDLQINVDDEKGMFCFKSGDQYGAIMKLNV